MSYIKRHAKSSVQPSELLQEVKDKLGIDEFIRCNCQPKNQKLSSRMPYDFCLNKCWHICEPFFSWQHIPEACENMFCSEDNLCEECVKTIDKYKILLQVFRVIFPLTKRKRTKRLCKYKKKRHNYD